MTLKYQIISWNKHKYIYDGIILCGIFLFISTFLGISLFLSPHSNILQLIIRATSLCAFFLIHIVLSIGPLARLSTSFSPFLYNRRHLGIIIFFLAFIHAFLVLLFYHGFGVVNPLHNILLGYAVYPNISQFPFEWFGAIALSILFLMAVTSHDFWLKNLTAPIWKALHMSVYIMYACLIGHVFFGVLQSDTHPALFGLSLFGAFWITGLHLVAAYRTKNESKLYDTAHGDWIHVGKVDAILDNKAKIISVSGERVAIFRQKNTLHAISNVCQHQNGPLGEGKIVNGCVTCPWHGFQYVLETGKSPAPFTETVPTFDLKIIRDAVYVSSKPNPLGSKSIGVPIKQVSLHDNKAFYCGYLSIQPKLKKHCIIIVAILYSLGILYAGLWGLFQNNLEKATVQYATIVSYNGTIADFPYPHIIIHQDNTVQRILLTASGKHGATNHIQAYKDTYVSFQGYEIGRNNTVNMIEIIDSSIQKTVPKTQHPIVQTTPIFLKDVSVIGEIVDSKCFYGAMNPNQFKVHKACAILCIKGGVPPILHTASPIHHEGAVIHQMILIDIENNPVNTRILDKIGIPLRIRGKLFKYDNLYILKANPSLYKPIVR